MADEHLVDAVKLPHEPRAVSGRADERDGRAGDDLRRGRVKRQHRRRAAEAVRDLPRAAQERAVPDVHAVKKAEREDAFCLQPTSPQKSS